MPLNLPNEIWVVLIGAGVFFLGTLILLYIAYRLLRPRADAAEREG